MIIPTKVEEKIRYLIHKFPHTEWSGVLFCSHKGSFENNDLTITCEDIYPMDLGTEGWTEFKMSEDVAAYIAENVELFDCDMQLVHSHHSLGAFLSGQDMKMVQQEGNDTNCFVSLVVDTPGNYVAIVTRKVQTKSEVTIKKLGTSYEFFGEGTKSITHDGTVTTKTIDKEVIEYFDLEIERHEIPNALSYLDTRFEEIEQKKKQSKATKAKDRPITITGNDEYWDHLANTRGYPKLTSSNDKESQEGLLPLFNSKDNKLPITKRYSYDGMNWQPDPKEVHAAAVHIITLNFILNPDKIDLKQWITRHMMNAYKKIFGEHSLVECEKFSSGAFSDYLDFIIQFTLDNFNYDTVPDAIMEEDPDYVYSMVAQSLIDDMFEYIEVNPYMKAYYDTLSQYL